MAEIVKDFTNDQSRYEQVLFQRGRKVIDGELNEIGRLIRVKEMRKSYVNVSNTGEVASRRGFVRARGIEVVPGPGVAEVTLRPISGQKGYIFFRGYIIELAGSTVLSGIADPAPADEIYQLYVEITETEVSTAIDPTILVQQLGETARRLRATATFQLGAANVDSAGAANTVNEPWENGTKAGLIAEIRRPNAVAGITTASQILPKWHVAEDFQAFTNKSLAVTSAPAVGGSMQLPGYFQWDFSLNNLSIENVAIVLPGRVHAAGVQGPQIAVIGNGAPLVANLPNPGDCLVAMIPGPKKEATSTSRIIDYTLTSPAGPEQLQLYIENSLSYADGIPPAASGEDGFSDRFIIATRGFSNEVFLYDGRVIDTELNVTETRSNRLYVGGTNRTHDVPRHDFAEVATPTVDSDNTAWFRSRVQPRSTHYKLLASFPSVGTSGLSPTTTLRVYQAREVTNAGVINGSGIVLTSNAFWNTATSLWNSDDATDSGDQPDADHPAIIWRFLAQQDSGVDIPAAQMSIGHHDPATGGTSWADDAWSKSASGGSFGAVLEGTGNLIAGDVERSIIEGYRRIVLTGTSDPTSVGPGLVGTNRLYAANICKAYGLVGSDGGGGVLLPTTAFNIASAAINGSFLEVTFKDAMANVEYVPQVTVLGASAGNAPNVYATVIAPGVVRIEARDIAGALVNLGAVAANFYLTVHGIQT